MSDEFELKRKSGAATVLALLVTFLLGYAPASAQVQHERSAQLGPAELVKRGTALRTSVRGEADDTDPDTIEAVPPRVHTVTVAVRPAASDLPNRRADVPSAATLAYRARAPPAA